MDAEEKDTKKSKISKLDDDKKTKTEEKEELKKKKEAKKEVKKNKDVEDDDELLDDEEESSVGIQIITALVVVAIIVILLLKSCDNGKKEYNVTFDTNGGTLIADVVVEEENAVSKPSEPTKEGYEFVGWYYNDELYDFSKPVTGNITLEARWAELANASGVMLDQTTVKLSPGGTTTLVATVTPETAKDKSLTWESSNPEIVTVDANGNITAIKEGSATVTVKTTDGGFTAEAKVTVSKDVVAVTGVTLNKTSLNLGPTESSTLTVTIKPSSASNKGITWSSSNEAVATVDANGKVIAKKDGTAVITVTTKDGSYTATCNVTVKTIKVTGIRVSNETVTIKENRTTTVTATVTPTNATNKGVTWTSADPTVAKVSSTGKITGIKEGTTTITVTTKDGNYSKTITVTVTKPIAPESVSISGDSTGVEGGKITLKATVLPGDADNKTVTWTSSNTDIATVSSKGVVTLKKAGKVTITATTSNGKTATHEITIKEKPASYVVTFAPIVQEGTGAILQYSVTVTKNGSTFTGFKGFSYNGAAVKPNGTVVATKIDKGITSVTITLSDGEKVTATVKYK